MRYVQIYWETKSKRIELLVKNLPATWDIFVPRFIDEEIDFKRKTYQEYVFNDPIFSSTLSKDEIISSEEWLGHPFHLILRYNYMWYKNYSYQPKILQKHYELLAKMVLYYKAFFTKNKIEFLSNNVDCRYPFVVATLVAKRLGLKSAIIVGGRLAKTMMIYDFDFKPVFWKKLNEDDIKSAKKFFLERYDEKTKKQENSAVLDENKGRYSLLGAVHENMAKCYKKAFYKKKNKPLQYLPMHALAASQIIRQIRKFVVPSLLETPDLTSNFLFFPIHYDEEAHFSWASIL